MKELSIEEKVKRYDEIREKARKEYSIHEANNAIGIMDALERVFPELQESEDEKIRKELLNAFQESEESLYMVLTPHKRESFIAWLEKQGEQILANSAKTCKDEQKPTEWSKSDETTFNHVIRLLKSCGECSTDIYKWLKSLKDRVQPKQEWSEEDESLRLRTIGALGTCKIGSPTKCVDEQINWLKSLRPQNRWKPSDEQMAALSDITVTGCISYAGQGQELINLYNDLKRLSKE